MPSGEDRQSEQKDSSNHHASHNGDNRLETSLSPASTFRGEFTNPLPLVFERLDLYAG